MRVYDAVIFDLDGTLLDTLEDLMDSVNHALGLHGLPLRSREEVRKFVGDGVAKLMARAVPTGTDEALIMACLTDFQVHYLNNMRNKTAPYPGILSMLEQLCQSGAGVAVVSNKFYEAVKVLCVLYFGDLIPVAVGESEKIPKKPAPDMVYQALEALGVTPGQAVYVGDSDVDIETAHRAGMPCISVTWGFRDQAFLAAHGATQIVESIEELAKLLLKD